MRADRPPIPAENLRPLTNVVLVGGVGLGKSHLVTALSLQTCERGHSVLFTSAIDAVNTLAAAKAAGQLKRDLRRYLRPRLLILDLCEAPSYVEFVPPIGDQQVTLTIGTQHD